MLVDKGKYLVFSRQGEMPQIAIDAWSDIWRYFTEGGAEYESTFSIHFEHYENGNHTNAYIAIK